MIFQLGSPLVAVMAEHIGVEAVPAECCKDYLDPWKNYLSLE